MRTGEITSFCWGPALLSAASTRVIRMETAPIPIAASPVTVASVTVSPFSVGGGLKAFATTRSMAPMTSMATCSLPKSPSGRRISQ
jgi:hypothetical protein